MADIVNWLKHDWLGVIVDIAILTIFIMIEDSKINAVFTVIYTILVTIQHYERYLRNKKEAENG
jgi:hypothetical protein